MVPPHSHPHADVRIFTPNLGDLRCSDILLYMFVQYAVNIITEVNINSYTHLFGNK
jgi:hypothetical protein